MDGSERVRRHVVARRAELGLTQSELADLAGVVRNTVAKLESGVEMAGVAEAKIERALGWPVGTVAGFRDGDTRPHVGVSAVVVARLRADLVRMRDEIDEMLRVLGE